MFKPDTPFNSCSLKKMSRLAGVKEIEPRRVIGRGAYGEVVEMTYFGTNVAGKKIHRIFFEANQEVGSEIDRFQEECTR